MSLRFRNLVKSAPISTLQRVVQRIDAVLVGANLAALKGHHQDEGKLAGPTGVAQPLGQGIHVQPAENHQHRDFKFPGPGVVLDDSDIENGRVDGEEPGQQDTIGAPAAAAR